MARGKYLSLEEAHKQKQLNRFCIEHPSKGNEKAFDGLLNTMTTGKDSEPEGPARTDQGPRNSLLALENTNVRQLSCHTSCGGNALS